MVQMTVTQKGDNEWQVRTFVLYRMQPVIQFHEHNFNLIIIYSNIGNCQITEL